MAKRQTKKTEQEKRESGLPGGGQGRIDEVGGSGVYPASGPLPEGNAPVQGMASWGQGERGAAGYQESGRSEVWFTEQELEAIKAQENQEKQGQGSEVF